MTWAISCRDDGIRSRVAGCLRPPRACCDSQRPSGVFRIGIGGFPTPGVISPSGALELTMGVIAHLAGFFLPASTTSTDFQNKFQNILKFSKFFVTLPALSSVDPTETKWY